MNFSISKKIVKTIYNPINIEEIDKIKPVEGFFDTSYYNLVTVGRLDKGKNHILLIKSIFKLVNKNKLHKQAKGIESKQLWKGKKS